MTAPKPMLAPNESVDFDDPRIPAVTLCSDKLDGMRVLAIDGVLYSRNLKPLRSEIQERWKPFLDASRTHVFDGEIFEYGNPDFGSLMTKIAKSGTDVPDTLAIQCFDCVPLARWQHKNYAVDFASRTSELEYLLTAAPKLNLLAKACNVVPLTQYYVDSPHNLELAFKAAIARGTEGLIVRDPHAPYKHGRATLLQGSMFKFKEWVTQDGRITGFKRGTKMKESVRTGERTRDAFGHREISHKKDTREPSDVIGSFEVTLQDGRIIGAGLKKGVDAYWDTSWEGRNFYLNRMVEVEYQQHGTKSLPRFSRITRLRPDLDL